MQWWMWCPLIGRVHNTFANMINMILHDQHTHPSTPNPHPYHPDVDMHAYCTGSGWTGRLTWSVWIQRKSTDFYLFLHNSHFIPSIQKTPFQTQLTTSATVCIIDNLSTHECGEGRSTLDKCKACLLKLFVKIMSKVNEWCSILLKDLLENLIQ